MPYVEVWVDADPLSDDQREAIRDLVHVSIDVAERHWPDDWARELHAAALEVARDVLLAYESDRRIIPSGDEQYRDWLVAKRDAAKATAETQP